MAEAEAPPPLPAAGPAPASAVARRRFSAGQWAAGAVALLLAAPVLLLLAVALFGANWARGPLQDLALRQTGRVLRLEGDLSLRLAWPLPRVRAEAVRLSNPAWAAAPELLVADAVEADIDALALLRGRLALPALQLVRPQVFLEESVDAAGVARKTWLFDLAQTDEGARIEIGRVRLDRGEVHYLHRADGSALRLALSTEDATPAAGGAAGEASGALVFRAEGRLRGMPLAAEGRGGSVLAWRDESRPYPLAFTARLGGTRLQARGTVTGLLRLAAVDLQLDLAGANLAALAPLLRLPLPPTPAYRTQGRLVREGALWRYAAFTGEVGRSDIAGTLQLDTAGARPMLRGGFSSRRLDLADLGPAVGVPEVPAARPAAGPARVLPELPFDTRLWGRLDADVAFAAQALLREGAQPLDRLQGRVQLQDGRLTLDPLAFGLAGGQLNARLVIDARSTPLRGQARLQLRGVQLRRLLPDVEMGRQALGRLDGDADLSGQGASVGRMLAVADGRVSLVVQHGLVSRLLMEKIGLHLLEILRLRLSGDEAVALHCAVADFGVKAGRMDVKVLVLDTEVSTVIGTGHVDLASETLALSLVPRTKVSSVLALRSPITLSGPFSQPVVGLDGGALATRSLGALALGLVNPLLALVPLFDAGPGADSPCARLVQAARSARP